MTYRLSSLLALTLAAVPALDSPPAAAQTVVDELEVRVLELDVTVRDRRGRGVAGLTRDDFAVFLDGVPLTLTNFRPSERAALRPLDSDAGTAETVAAPEPSHLVLYFDEISLDAGGRRDLARRLGAALAAAPAAGRIMVAGRQGFRLRIHQPFTERTELLLAAIEEALATAPDNPTPAAVSAVLLEVERALSAIDDAPRASAQARSRVLSARASTLVAETLQRMDRAAEVFEQLVFLLGGLEGRKGVLYVGDGLAVSPGEVIGGALRDAYARFEMRSVSDSLDGTSAASAAGGRLAAVAERAASRQVAVYALDTTAGLEQPAATAEYRSIDAGRSGGSAPTDSWTPGVASRRRFELQNALQTVAEATGGRLLTRSRDDLVTLLVEDLGTYYSLGVEAPAGDVAPGALEVRVAGRGLAVHHRRATPPRSRDSIDADRTIAALLGEPAAAGTSVVAGRRALSATARVHDVAAPAADDDRWTVSLAVTVPVADLRVAARDLRHEGQVSVFVATRDAAGRLSPVHKSVLPVSVANGDLATVAGQAAESRHELLLPAGTARIAVAVRDDLAPAPTLLTLDLEVGGATPTPPPS